LRLLIAALFAFFLSTPAQAGVVLNGVVVDPQGVVRGDLLTQALQAWRAHPEARRDRIAVVDFSRPSDAARFYLVDLSTGAVSAYLTAHGRGSDPAHSGVPQFFSNDPGSNASSLGAYLALRRYMGAHGLSLRLRGLDPQRNSNAEERAVVLHSAPYMDADWRRTHGKPGRSFGCFVVETRLVAEVVERLEDGVLIFAGR
jgi:hypothetical protein